MRHYESLCLVCGAKHQIAFAEEPYPEYGDEFVAGCSLCAAETMHTRVLTKKTAAEIRKKAAEDSLRQSIISKCHEYGFTYRFLYQSVIINTPLSDWCFDYHESKITLYHESTVKINFETADYAKSHIQFRARKMTPTEVIDYIASHDEWRSREGSTGTKNNTPIDD